MSVQDDGFEAILNRVRGGEVEPGQARLRLEEDLTPLVRRILRTGYGPPSVVRWVEQARSRLAPTLGSLSFDHAARYLGRLLSRAVLDRYMPHAGGTAVAWETAS